VADGNSVLDLFGDPVEECARGRGRPEHKWTLRNSNKVLLLFAARRSKADAAAAIGVSVRTLEKHYFRELSHRHTAALRFEAEQLDRLNEQAKAGNVGAEKELRKMLERSVLEQLPKSMKPAKPEKVGKKQQRKIDAAEPPKSSWGELLEGSAAGSA
jgi:hypothetical protein